jgi:hypothetical protein
VGASREGLANTLIYFMLLFVYTTTGHTRTSTMFSNEQNTTPNQFYGVNGGFSPPNRGVKSILGFFQIKLSLPLTNDDNNSILKT